MPLLDLALAEADLFKPQVGRIFRVSIGNSEYELELTEVVIASSGPMPGGTRIPFSLSFRGASGLRIPQQIHRLENEGLGPIEIFLVQVGNSPKGSEFEAVFS